LKEETAFWEILSDKGLSDVRGRLQSFFYKTQLQQAIDLKINNQNKK